MQKKGFGKPQATPAVAAKPRNKPLKRPQQARAQFTVEVIYQALVRIWQRSGWQGVTTRAVALEAGFAVGTLYEYFPSKQAMLSGYVRYNIERLLARIEREVVEPSLTWQQRVCELLRLSGGVEPGMHSLFSVEVAKLESEIAEPKHYRRAYEEMLATWQRVFAACDDLPKPLSAERVEALFLLVWGGRRYAALGQLDETALGVWLSHTQSLLLSAIAAAD